MHRASFRHNSSSSLSEPQSRSTSAPREARLHSPWNRSACDRCRAHKLKCQREGKSATGTCIRCDRAGEVCFTSSAKSRAAHARPQPSPTTIGKGMADSHGAPYEDDSATRAPMRLSRDSVMHQESAFLMRWPFPNHRDVNAAAIDFDFEADLLSAPEEGESPSYAGSEQPTVPDEVSPPLFDRASTMSATSVAMSLDLLINKGWSKDSTTSSFPIHEPKTTTVNSAPPPEASLGSLLADRQQDFFRQLAVLESMPWDFNFDITSSATIATGSQHNPGQSEPVNPVASILAGMSQFATVLNRFEQPLSNEEAYRVDRQEPHHHQRDSNQSRGGWLSPVPSQLLYHDRPLPAGHAQLLSGSPRHLQQAYSRVHLLTTINCYLLVLTILNKLLSRLLAEALEPSARGLKNHSSAPPPLKSNHRAASGELVFAGHSVTLSTRLRTRLLLQVVEDQLEILENALGLPSLYRVTSTGRDEDLRAKGGILSARESLFLFQAVMGSTPDLDNRTTASTDAQELGSSSILSSVREKLRR